MFRKAYPEVDTVAREAVSHPCRRGKGRGMGARDTGPVLPGPAELLTGLAGPGVAARARRLLHHLSQTGRRLATAESCTGGLLAAFFSDVPGLGHVLDRGWIVYDEQAKVDLLGVDADLIRAHGVVSREVATAMAEGALERSPAHVVVAVTGYADVGAQPGLNWLAVAAQDHRTVTRRHVLGGVGRGAVRVGVVEAAVRLLEEVATGPQRESQTPRT